MPEPPCPMQSFLPRRQRKKLSFAFSCLSTILGTIPPASPYYRRETLWLYSYFILPQYVYRNNSLKNKCLEEKNSYVKMLILKLMTKNKTSQGNILFSRKKTYRIERIVFMGQIQVEKTEIEGLCIITPSIHKDARGYFMESYNERDFQEQGLNLRFVQDNQSMSVKGVLRGLHFQKQYPQGKLVRVLKGRVYDVAVDLRKNSKTYGKHFGIILSEENKKMFYIPEGFAHGFLVLSDTAEFAYKVTDFYHPGDEGGLAWNDPSIGIQWPELKGNYAGNAKKDGYSMEDGSPLLLSEKDELWLPLSETFAF